jgi:hypothetical protein
VGINDFQDGASCLAAVPPIAATDICLPARFESALKGRQGAPQILAVERRWPLSSAP